MSSSNHVDANINTYHLMFVARCEWHPYREHHYRYVEALTLEDAIRAIERQNDDWYFVACVDQWQGHKITWGLR